MRYQVTRYALIMLLVLGIGGFALGEQSRLPKVLFTYKDKQFTVEDLTGVEDQEALTIIREEESKYDLKKYTPLDGFLRPALAFWKPMGDVTPQKYYEHQLQGVVEYFIQFEVFELYKQRHSVEIKDYYRGEVVQEAIRRLAELHNRVPSVILSALDEKVSEAETIGLLKKGVPESNFKDEDWARSIKSFSLHRPYFALNRRLFPWTVGGKPALWVEHLLYSSLIEFHIQAEIERDKPKYIRMLEDRFGRRNYFVIRKAQDSDKEQLLKLINLVTNRKGEVARGGVEKINKTLRELNSSTKMELWFGAKISLAKEHKIPEDQIKPKQFISLGKMADGMESYLYIFQEEPTPHFKEYFSTPGRFLYSTAKYALLRPLVEEVRASIKAANRVTVRATDEIVRYMGDVNFSDTMFGAPLPKVLLK